MPEASERMLFLLGAGASVEAGLPTSVDLTTSIAQAIEAGHRREIATTLNVVMGAMYAHGTSRGRRVSDGLDVESVFAAVEQLAHRDELEIAPFVNSWVGGLETLGAAELPNGWGKKFTEVAQDTDGFFDHELQQMFAKAVRQLSGNSDIGPPMRLLRKEMLRALERVLQVDPRKIDYLAPLLANAASGKVVRIVTLNYDSTIEDLAKKAGYVADTGLGAWAGGYGWEFDPHAQVQLLKLHGSLGWQIARDYSVNDGRLPGDRLFYSEGATGEWAGNVQPALVFGQGTKLRSDGPFLAMLVEFDRMLSETDHVVVIGYSFRDQHVNTQLRRWLADELGRRVTVIDRKATEWTTGFANGPDFVTDLRRAKASATQPDDYRPHSFIGGTAKKELAKLLGRGPTLSP